MLLEEYWPLGYTITDLAKIISRELGYPPSELENTRKRLSKYASRNKEKIEKPAKIEIFENLTPEVSELPWKGERTIRFGLMGDPQFSSHYVQITHLHKYYDICKDSGITDIYNTGDIDEGEQMRKGHQYECYKQGADAHAEEIVKNYPKRKGITTHFITGNHDASLMKLAGFNIGKAIAKDRPDMKYLGPDCAQIYLTPNCILELRHPWDATAYALSYKVQKMVEAMMGGEKPNILAVGHYHKAEYFFYRNVHCFQTGCFQAQTSFMRGKGIAAMMGGWIVEIKVNCDGQVDRIRQEFIPFYKAIKDDYRQWQ